MARIGIQTWGSEGDVAPFIALSAGLAGRGHEVELAVTDLSGRRYVAPAGVKLTHVAVDAALPPGELDAVSRDCLVAGKAHKQGAILVERLFRPAVPEMAAAATELAARSDLIVRHHFLHPAHAAAERAGIPQVSVFLAPDTIPTRVQAPTGLPSLGGWLNGAFWGLASKMVDRMLLANANEVRAQLGLQPIRSVIREAWFSPPLTLVASSPALWPRPGDWPDHIHACGVMRAAAGHTTLAVPAELDRFLGAGAPPVYVSFGSLFPKSDPDRAELVRVLAEAARKSACRMIIQAEGDHGDLGPEIAVVPRAPHSLVFPRCAAVICHGGAGTTHTALEAGAPMVIVPHLADQFFWGAQLHRLGVAAKPLLRPKLTASALADRIRALLDQPGMKSRAADLGAALAKEDGVANAIEMISRVMPRAAA